MPAWDGFQMYAIISDMCRIKRLLCHLVVFAFMLSSMPAAAHLCLHDMQNGKAGAAIEKASDALPPCHPQAAEQDAAKTKPQGKMDCCGDKCACASGTCAGTTALPGMKADSLFTALSTVDYISPSNRFLPFIPEQATPPPRI